MFPVLYNTCISRYGRYPGFKFSHFFSPLSKYLRQVLTLSYVLYHYIHSYLKYASKNINGGYFIPLFCLPPTWNSFHSTTLRSKWEVSWQISASHTCSTHNLCSFIILLFPPYSIKADILPPWKYLLLVSTRSRTADASSMLSAIHCEPDTKFFYYLHSAWEKRG